MYTESNLTFQRESFANTIDEGRPLLYAHWKEVARNQDLFPLDPDEQAYALADTIGAIRIYTARDMGVMCGYAIYFVKKHPHYRTVTWAVSDIFWMRRSARGTRGWAHRWARRFYYWLYPTALKSTPGIRFFNYIEGALKSEGVDVMHTTIKFEHPAAGRVLRYLGHEHIEAGYAKVLRG